MTTKKKKAKGSKKRKEQRSMSSAAAPAQPENKPQDQPAGAEGGASETIKANNEEH